MGITSSEPAPTEDQTTRVYAWYVNSDGKETHITRRGSDGRWYLTTTERGSEAQFVPMETAADLYALAIEEGRPYATVPHTPLHDRWLEAVDRAVKDLPSYDEEPYEGEDDSDVDGPGPDGK